MKFVSFLFWCPLGFWAIARAAGWLWNRNEGFSWKFMMCSGALGLVIATVIYDLTVVPVVKRVYAGPDSVDRLILLTNPGSAAGQPSKFY
jgi:hypothetical protein